MASRLSRSERVHARIPSMVRESAARDAGTHVPQKVSAEATKAPPNPCCRVTARLIYTKGCAVQKLIEGIASFFLVGRWAKPKYAPRHVPTAGLTAVR